MDLSNLQATLSTHGYHARSKDHYLSVSLGALAYPVKITFDYSSKRFTYTCHSTLMTFNGALLLVTSAISLSGDGGIFAILSTIAGVMLLMNVIITEIRLVELKQLIKSLDTV